VAQGDPLVDGTAPLEVERRTRHLTDHTGRWRRPSADGIELFNIAPVPVTRYRYRGSKIPSPWTVPSHA